MKVRGLAQGLSILIRHSWFDILPFVSQRRGGRRFARQKNTARWASEGARPHGRGVICGSYFVVSLVVSFVDKAPDKAYDKGV